MIQGSWLSYYVVAVYELMIIIIHVGIIITYYCVSFSWMSCLKYSTDQVMFLFHVSMYAQKQFGRAPNSNPLFEALLSQIMPSMIFVLLVCIGSFLCRIFFVTSSYILYADVFMLLSVSIHEMLKNMGRTWNCIAKLFCWTNNISHSPATFVLVTVYKPVWWRSP